MKRMKAPRAGVKSERLRTPYPLPRATGKTKYPRPSPSSRKRRLSGRMMRPALPANASEEGDMAQADEMGEGEGRDDGFVEGVDPISRRRNKKRPGKTREVAKMKMCALVRNYVSSKQVCLQFSIILWEVAKI